MGDTGTSRSTVGGAQQQGNVTYGVMPEQVTRALSENGGSEFIVIQQDRQSSQPKIWSSGDPEQTKSLFRNARNAVDTLETTG
jgi:hypothetical protein